MKAVHGHRWTQEELARLMRMWDEDKPLVEIAAELKVTAFAVNKIVLRLRKEGVPLRRRTNGHKYGRSNKLWSQAEIEYLFRRRKEKATAEEIGHELGRSVYAVNAMITKLRQEQVNVPMLGQGVRRLWSAELLIGKFGMDALTESESELIQ